MDRGEPAPTHPSEFFAVWGRARARVTALPLAARVQSLTARPRAGGHPGFPPRGPPRGGCDVVGALGRCLLQFPFPLPRPNTQCCGAALFGPLGDDTFYPPGVSAQPTCLVRLLTCCQGRTPCMSAPSPAVGVSANPTPRAGSLLNPAPAFEGMIAAASQHQISPKCTAEYLSDALEENLTLAFYFSFCPEHSCSEHHPSFFLYLSMKALNVCTPLWSHHEAVLSCGPS